MRIIYRRLTTIVQTLPPSTKEFTFQPPKVKEYLTTALLQTKDLFQFHSLPYTFNSIQYQHPTRKSKAWHLFQQRHSTPQLLTQLTTSFNQYQAYLASSTAPMPLIEHNLKLKYLSARGSAISNQVVFKLIPNPAFKEEEGVKVVDVQYVVGLNKSRHLNLDLSVYSKKETQKKHGFHLFILDPINFKNQTMTQPFHNHHRQVILRLTLQIQPKSLLTCNYRGNQVEEKQQNSHIVVFQSQLGTPPLFSQFEGSVENWVGLAKKRQDWWISDVDRHNEFIELAYDSKTLKKIQFAIVN